MSRGAELRTLFHLLRGQPRSGSHEERLEAFYAPQARSYDSFRERLLQGREELVRRLDVRPGASVLELGCGTGRNIEFFGERVLSLKSVELVDLCEPLLAEARRRAARWPEVVKVTHADAECYRPDQAVDCVYLSYSLSMTAQWHKTLCNAVRMLRPGGTLGVVDFFVSDDSPPPGWARHGWLTRNFWPRWFAHDGVRLSSEPLRTLADRTITLHFEQRLAPVPWLPLVKVPYYLYVGRKRRN